MAVKKKEFIEDKVNLHPRSRHRKPYDFEQLCALSSDLVQYVHINKYNRKTIDFSNPEAVRALNKTLLLKHYNLNWWNIPKGYLCPPIPGRAEYIHQIADLLFQGYSDKIVANPRIKGLDIGVGASLIYPIIGSIEYGWNFIGSDIDPVSLESARKIIDQNTVLQGKIELRLQTEPKNAFEGILTEDDIIDITICNPPFHSSMEEAQASSRRKVNNLSNKRNLKPFRNFGGISTEIICEGGEKQFITDMINQSVKFGKNCLWFSTLVSKHTNLGAVHEALKSIPAMETKTITMYQGNKKSRIVAWTFLTPEQHIKWKALRWGGK